MPSPHRSSRPEPQFDSAWATAGEIAAAVTAGRVSAAAVVEDALARITQRDPVLNSFTDVLVDRVRILDCHPAPKFGPGVARLPSDNARQLDQPLSCHQS